MAYVSEAFAATLAAAGHRDFALEHASRVTRPKNYAGSLIYRLQRRGAADGAQRAAVRAARIDAAVNRVLRTLTRDA